MQNLDLLFKYMPDDLGGAGVDDFPPDDLPPDGADTPGEGPAGESPEEVEKYSAQVIRRMHQDAQILLEEYEDMREHLEHPEVDGHVQKKLESLVDELEQLETMFTTHHPEASPLEGMGGGMGGEPEMGGAGAEEATPEPSDAQAGNEVMEADSADEDLPTPDEAVEGMGVKALRGQYIKALRSYYKRMPGEDAGKASATKDKKSKKSFPEMQTETQAAEVTTPQQRGLTAAKLAEHEKAHVKDAHGFLKGISTASALESGHKMEAYHFAKVLEPIGFGFEGSHMPGAEAHSGSAMPMGQGMKSLDTTPKTNFKIDMDEGMWWVVGQREKKGFRDGPFNDEFRAQSTLEVLHKAFPCMDSKESVEGAISEAGTNVGKQGGKSQIPGDMQWQQEEAKESAHQEADKPTSGGSDIWSYHRKNIGSASHYLKELADTDPLAFGEHHRREAHHHGENLMHAYKEEEEQLKKAEKEAEEGGEKKPKEELPEGRHEPDVIGDVDEKRLMEEVARQAKELEILQKSLERILA